jgi:hypothetical protein
MAINIEIRCINKSNRTSHYERILSIGGVKPDGNHWKMSEADAIVDIEKGVYTFYVNREGFQ